MQTLCLQTKLRFTHELNFRPQTIEMHRCIWLFLSVDKDRSTYKQYLCPQTIEPYRSIHILCLQTNYEFMHKRSSSIDNRASQVNIHLFVHRQTEGLRIDSVSVHRHQYPINLYTPFVRRQTMSLRINKLFVHRRQRSIDLYDLFVRRQSLDLYILEPIAHRPRHSNGRESDQIRQALAAHTPQTSHPLAKSPPNPTFGASNTTSQEEGIQ